MKPMQHYTLMTGGSEGIGYELAKIFAANGHDLILVARDEQNLEKARAELTASGTEVLTIATDLFEPDAAFRLYNNIKERGLQVDILVNNAGQGVYGLFEETDISRELAIIQLDIASLVVLTKLFLKDMLQKGSGKILNLSSIASKTPGRGNLFTTAPKHLFNLFLKPLEAR